MTENIVATNVSAPPKREYTALECVFGWISLFAGFFFCRLFPIVSKPFANMIFVFLLFAVTAVFVYIKGAKPNGMSIFALVSSLTLSAALFLSSNSSVHSFAGMYIAINYLYFVLSSFGNTIENGFSNLVIADYFKALFIMPFVSFADVFCALSQGKSRERFKIILKILIGIAIAFVPTVIVVSLLSYDDGFVEILKSIFRFDFHTIVVNVFSIVFGVPVGMYIFGAFISSSDKKCESALTARSIRKTAKQLRLFSPISAVAASLPILVLYVVFFISQWKYYVSGFVGMLPDNESYAQYARDGFFQLCAVAVINFVIMLALSLFMKRNEKNKSFVLKILSLVFSLFTLILISTALAKMLLYINRYGLTPKRVYASWFMLVLALVFIISIFKQFVRRFKIVPNAIIISVVMFAVVAIGGTEEFIAKYNVDRYIEGTLETVDVSAIEDLGDSGVPQLVRLAKHLDKKNGTSIKKSVKNFDIKMYNVYYEGGVEVSPDLYDNLVKSFWNMNLSKYKETDVLSLTMPRIRAENALKGVGLIKK